MTTKYKATPIDSIVPTVEHTRAFFNTGKTKEIDFRKAQLKAFYRCIKENEELWHTAVSKDLNVSKNQVFLRSTALIYNELSLALNNVASWAAPEFPSVPMLNKMDQAQIRRDPKGMALVIGAWNYPFQLALIPVINAIAAGCTVVLKPSELSENTAALIAELLPKYLEPGLVSVINGAVPETSLLLEQKFDHILYTGNSQVARIVSAAAAKHLTPLTLELGGKSPAIVDKGCDLAVVARRIAWGSMFNCGQTCIRVDYVLCPKELQDQLVTELKKHLSEFYGEEFKEEDQELGRIINDRHYARVTKMIDATKGKIVYGNKRVPDKRYLSPTIVIDVKEDDVLMGEEIFGPVLPIVNVESDDDAIAFVNKRDKPLALYVFTERAAYGERMINETSSGAVIVNDVIMHSGNSALPFGGIGESGQGAYHGKHGFDTFTHFKAVMKKKLNMESVNDIRYPPTTEKKLGWLKFLAVNEPREKWFGLF